VREEQGGRPFSRVMLEYFELVDEKLPKARAIAYLMQADEHNTPDGTLEGVSGLVAALLDEVILARKAMEGECDRELRRKREGTDPGGARCRGSLRVCPRLFQNASFRSKPPQGAKFLPRSCASDSWFDQDQGAHPSRLPRIGIDQLGSGRRSRSTHRWLTSAKRWHGRRGGLPIKGRFDMMHRDTNAPGDARDSASAHPRQWLDALVGEAGAHPALNHPWLEAIAASAYPDMKRAIRDYAYQYQAYANAFPRYLQAVIDKLENATYRQILERNLREERGELEDGELRLVVAGGLDPQEVAGVSHPELYTRFCRALGVGQGEADNSASAGSRWRDKLLDYIQDASPAAALGAIGPGTESVVKPIYRKVLRGLRALEGLERRDYVFFELHCIVDDQHALDLESAALGLLTTSTDRARMRDGMLKALDFRREFWDSLHARATAGSATEAAE